VDRFALAIYPCLLARFFWGNEAAGCSIPNYKMRD
jgi:hypothetical protein